MNPFGRGARGRDSEVGGSLRRRSTRGSSGGSLDPADQRFSKSARYHVICVNRFDPAVFFLWSQVAQSELCDLGPYSNLDLSRTLRLIFITTS